MWSSVTATAQLNQYAVYECVILRVPPLFFLGLIVPVGCCLLIQLKRNNKTKAFAHTVFILNLVAFVWFFFYSAPTNRLCVYCLNALWNNRRCLFVFLFFSSIIFIILFLNAGLVLARSHTLTHICGRCDTRISHHHHHQQFIIILFIFIAVKRRLVGDCRYDFASHFNMFRRFMRSSDQSNDSR